MADSTRKLNMPISGNELMRPAGIASMMRLPVQKTTEGLDACFVGIPLDIGTSHRSGSRMGPRHIRLESALLRPGNPTTGAAPFESLQVADIGDIKFNTYSLSDAVSEIRTAFKEIIKDGCIPLTIGGDHTLSYPILQAMKEKYGKVGIIHIDAHSDTNESMLGAPVAHGTPFRRAIEEGCVETSISAQIGLRGSGYTIHDYDWVKQQGVRVVTATECWYKSMNPLMKELREVARDKPIYITFDIDGLDPAYAPGTGVPEIGGLTTTQALEIIRGCRGMNIVGCDLVEVSPPYDPTGQTSITAANLLFEMLCVLPNVKYY